MANYTISKIELPNGDVCKLKADGVGPYFVVGPDTDTTAGTWTGTIDGLTAYYDGLTVIYVPHVAGASNTYLNINGLGAVLCYYSGTTKLTTHYPVGTPILLTYYGERWRRADYDSNSTNIYNLNYGNGPWKAASVLYRYQMLVMTDEDTLSPLNNVSNNTGTSKAMLTDLEFLPFGKFLYYNSTTTISAGSNIGVGSCQYAFSGIDLRYSFNCGNASLTYPKDLYLKVTPLANGKVKIAGTMPLTQQLPSTDDGFWYIYLGRTYNAYCMALRPEHPVYCHDGTCVRRVYEWLNPATVSETVAYIYGGGAQQ